MNEELAWRLIGYGGILWLLAIGSLLRSDEFQADLLRWITG